VASSPTRVVLARLRTADRRARDRCAPNSPLSSLRRSARSIDSRALDADYEATELSSTPTNGNPWFVLDGRQRSDPIDRLFEVWSEAAAGARAWAVLAIASLAEFVQCPRTMSA